MNEFDKRMNALRRQYAAEQAQITKDAYRTIGHLITAISQTSFPEAREALRAEKERVYEAMRTSHKYNRRCYLQQLELIQDQYSIHLEKNPSKRKLRHMIARFSQIAQSDGQNEIKLQIDKDRTATIIFD